MSGTTIFHLPPIPFLFRSTRHAPLSSSARVVLKFHLSVSKGFRLRNIEVNPGAEGPHFLGGSLDYVQVTDKQFRQPQNTQADNSRCCDRLRSSMASGETR